MTTTLRVGLIGTGALGSRLALASVDGGHPTSVWNRTAARTDPLIAAGAQPSSTVADLVRGSDVVVTVVSSADGVRAALTGQGVDLSGRLIVNLTSTTPDDAAALHAEVTARGGRFLDGAAMGGTRRVGDPSAMYFYSGDEAVFDLAGSVLRSFGTPLFLGADPGSASRYDTAVLGVILGFLTAGFQALALLRPHGVTPTAFADLIRDYSPYIVDLFADQAHHLESGSYAAEDGSVDVYIAALKHLRDTSAQSGVDTTLNDAVGLLLRRASDAGRGGQGLAALADAFATAPVR